MRSDDGVLIVDDSISEKPYTDPNGLVCPYYDHSKDRFVNGINFVTLLYRAKGIQLPIGFVLVIKSLQCLLKDRKEVWRSEKTKNEMLRELVKQACQNSVRFTYLLCDSWYVNAENINFIRSLTKHLIGAVKSNLEVALSAQERAHGKFVRISHIDLKVGVPQLIYIRSVKEPVVVCKDIFINENGSEGELFLLSTNVTNHFQQIITTYQERWGVEDYHNGAARAVIEKQYFFIKITHSHLTDSANPSHRRSDSLPASVPISSLNALKSKRSLVILPLKANCI